MSEQDDNPEVGATEENQAQFSLQRIYVKDASFESPKAPDCFRGNWQPKINLELNSRHAIMENDLYEVILNVTVTSRNDEDEVVYLTEVQQAGIFLIKGLDDAALARTLGSFCSSVLFPYAREAIDTLVTKGSFPALMLAPVNFDAIYEESLKQQQAKATIQ
ncbi:MAG: protein-export chaperone SecB [Pseudomonadales bacterium]|jgi:preprotein translocase subunit SecB|nr:protein-export chaperone SecB [Pseudomonadales bacterium]MDP6315823.1 protein-export chaperone SecB [Pseudomonadales bacterium]MDP7313353.1 protein-export chaperone SecB [Pseudomonadales bacterium]MDP7575536.1 protein-export chaperone SecB [Pseudomonadales bacterium]|tara:strand:+ start:311 stop:796 length:486 start_codon:yes stop_codon:yes gene_type:complete